jgi:hypothetical protein
MMVVLLVLVFLAALLAVAAGASQKREQRALDEWTAVAHELGLKLTASGEDARSMGGVLNGMPVRADFRRRVLRTRQRRDVPVEFAGVEETTSVFVGRLPAYDAVARRAHLEPIEVTGEANIPESLVVRADTLGRSLGRFVEGRDDIGDQPIGDAALSFTARQQLRSLIERGGQVHQGRVEYERRVAVSHDRAWLVPLLRSMSKLGKALSVRPDTLHQRLADNARHDPIAAVRSRNLRFLSDPHTRTPEALVASTARALLSDVSSPVRLQAARQLPAEGRPVLRALAAAVSLETELRVEALQALDERGAPDPELLSRLLGSGPPELASAALAIIAARRLDGLSPAVVMCAQSEHAAVRAAVAGALGSLPAERAEGVLIQLLSDSSRDVQQASAESLGAIGSVAAVEPLLPLAEGLGRAQLRQAARAAIGRIQSRLGQVEAGRLSLAEERPLAGAVALAEAPAMRVGELSLADDEELTSASGEPLLRRPRTEP